MDHGFVGRAGPHRAAEACTHLLRGPAPVPDPLGEDREDDPRRSLSERELARVVFTAAETGHRFAREGRNADPAAWMYASRRLFDGEAPVEACATRHGFVAAMLLHGVWPDLDVEPAVIEQLLDVGEDCPPLPCRPLLFTAVLASDTTTASRYAFYAVAALDRDEAHRRLIRRLGVEAANLAVLRRGFDIADAGGRALLPAVIHDVLARLSRRSSIPADLEVLVDYRMVP